VGADISDGDLERWAEHGAVPTSGDGSRFVGSLSELEQHCVRVRGSVSQLVRQDELAESVVPPRSAGGNLDQSVVHPEDGERDLIPIDEMVDRLSSLPRSLLCGAE
jgi:hypothetical protein